MNQCFVRKLCGFRNFGNYIRKDTLHFAGATVEAKRKFIDVTLHVFPAHVMVNAVIPALEQGPKRFNAVRVAIAQMINVLQAMILTDNEKMTVTPSYWVFEMDTVHHDATLLPSELQSVDYAFDGKTIPAVSASASRDKAGRIHVTLCNLNPNQSIEVPCELQGAKATKLSGRILAAPEMNAHNTFDQPDNVKLTEFNAFKLTDNGFVTTLPAKSVVVLEVD